MGKSLFWKGVFLGAIAGGALSLLDKGTRQTVAANCKKTTSEITQYIKHPNEAISQVREMTNKVKSAIEQVTSDVSYIASKVEELKEGTAESGGLEDDFDESYKEWPIENKN
jgi:gas vesicle protein